jgi:hypothetical protein
MDSLIVLNIFEIPEIFLKLLKIYKHTYKQLLLEAHQHKKYAQTTPLDDGVSSLFYFQTIILC